MTFPASKIKVAVLGTGSIGMRHLATLKKMKRVEAIAIPKREERLAALKQDGWVVVPNLKSAHELGVTCCIIATDTNRHIEDGILALELGMDILVEKPMASNAKAANVLWQKAKEKNLKIFVGCNLRFSESLTTFRELLPQIGPVHSVCIECQSYLPDWRPDRPYRESYSARSGEGGVLLDLIHEIDYAGWIFGWPTVLHSELKNLGRLNIETEEMAHLFWKTSAGAAVTISLDYLTRIPRRKMRAHGAKGNIKWDGIANSVLLELAGEQTKVFPFSQTRDQMMQNQLQAFLNCRLKNGSGPLATAKEGILALTICDTARKQ